MARRARCWRVRSVFTPQVNVNEAAKVSVHAALVKMASGQLPFLGSIHTAHTRHRVKKGRGSRIGTAKQGPPRSVGGVPPPATRSAAREG